MTKHAPEIVELRSEIEKSMNRLMRAPSDFEFLTGAIWERMHQSVSSMTLKRLWGYIDGAEVTRRSTLELLCQFLGYNNWEDYLEKLDDRSGIQSNLLLDESLQTAHLTQGDCVEVSWQPNRRCRFRFLGELQFEVIESEHSKLKVGDRFDCAFFILKQPLYIDNLVQGTNEPVCFVAGNKGGLTEVIKCK